MAEICALHGGMERYLERIESKVDVVVEGQQAQAKTCAAQCEKVAALQESDKEQWKAITTLRRSQNIGIGIIVAIQVVGLPIVFMLLKGAGK